MSNGTDQQENCVLEACCGEDKPKQARALASQLHHYLPDIPPEHVRAIAVFMVGRYDFAPVGTLYEFKEAIIRYARGIPFSD